MLGTVHTRPFQAPSTFSPKESTFGVASQSGDHQKSTGAQGAGGSPDPPRPKGEQSPRGETGKRFWGKEMSQDKLSAYQTLYTCLETVAKLLAPFAPFYADQLYLDLTKATGRDNVCSVHLAKFPEADETFIDKDLEQRMGMAQKITSMVLALRQDAQ